MVRAPRAAVLCTGVLALALSAVPALTLWLGDAGLLASRTRARRKRARWRLRARICI